MTIDLPSHHFPFAILPLDIACHFHRSLSFPFSTVPRVLFFWFPGNPVFTFCPSYCLSLLFYVPFSTVPLVLDFWIPRNPLFTFCPSYCLPTGYFHCSSYFPFSTVPRVLDFWYPRNPFFTFCPFYCLTTGSFLLLFLRPFLYCSPCSGFLVPALPSLYILSILLSYYRSFSPQPPYCLDGVIVALIT